MAALSIQLPENMAIQSQEMASKLGMSRSQFIREAIQHEIIRQEKAMTMERLAGAFDELKQNEEYQKLANELDGDFDLPDEEERWWE